MKALNALEISGCFQQNGGDLLLEGAPVMSYHNLSFVMGISAEVLVAII